MIFVKEENYQKGAAAFRGLGGEHWRTPPVYTMLGFSTQTSKDCGDCGGYRDFPAFPVPVQPASDVIVYFPTIVVCTELGTKGRLRDRERRAFQLPVSNG